MKRVWLRLGSGRSNFRGRDPMRASPASAAVASPANIAPAQHRHSHLNPDSVSIRDRIGDRDTHARCSRRRHAATRTACEAAASPAPTAAPAAQPVIVRSNAGRIGRAAAGSTGGIREPWRRHESGPRSRRHATPVTAAIASPAAARPPRQWRRPPLLIALQFRCASVLGQWRGDKRGRTAWTAAAGSRSPDRAAGGAPTPSLAALTPPGGGAPPLAPTWVSTPGAPPQRRRPRLQPMVPRARAPRRQIRKSKRTSRRRA